MTQPKKWTPPENRLRRCSCRAKCYDNDGAGPNEIFFCPLHDAAREMAELLRDLVSGGLRVASKSIRDPFRFKLEQARALLERTGAR